MAEFVLDGISIRGIACAVPDNKVDNTEYYRQFGKEKVDTVTKVTGVRSSYRTTEEQTASDLCFVAANTLLENKGVGRDEIGACVFVSHTPDYTLPATACVLHKRLRLPLSCVAFDINLGCSGWVYGLNVVGSLMLTSNIDKALLLFGDTSIKTASPEDNLSVMLFGEGGSATLLEKDNVGCIKGELMTDGDGYKSIIIPSGAYRNRNGSRERRKWRDGVVRSDFDLYMNGTDVFAFSISKVPEMINNFVAGQEKGRPAQEIYDALVLHQANLFILRQISKKTKIPMDMIPVSIDRYGNTSGASIPITICDAYGEEESKKLRLLMCGFGIGLSWGIIDTVIDSNDIYPIQLTEEYYKEGGVSLDD